MEKLRTISGEIVKQFKNKTYGYFRRKLEISPIFLKLLFPKFNLRKFTKYWASFHENKQKKLKLIKLKIYEYNGKCWLGYKCFGETSRENLEKLGYTYFAKIYGRFRDVLDYFPRNFTNFYFWLKLMSNKLQIFRKMQDALFGLFLY